MDDNSISRPIENSLSSFEYAWGAGVHLCECDVVRASRSNNNFNIILVVYQSKHYYSLSLDCISDTLMYQGVTKDEKIIMCHDEDFQRLALMSSVKAATTVVKDLTLADIMRSKCDVLCMLTPTCILFSSHNIY